MAKIKTMNLIVSKIQMKENNDWGSVELDNLEPGLYLCENPDGSMFLTSKIFDGTRFGLWLPVSGIGEIYAREAEQNVFEQINHVLEKGFGSIESKLKSIQTTINNSDVILNDMMDGGDMEVKFAELNVGVDSLKKDIERLYRNIDNFQNNIGNHKPSIAEMSDAVVNIIKATK